MIREELLTGFRDYLQYERRFSIHTVEGYISDIDQFSTFLQIQYSAPQLSELTHHHIRSWAVKLLKDKTSSASVRRKLSALTHFFKWLRRKAILHHNPMTKVQLPKLPERLPKAIPESNLMKLWDILSNPEISMTYAGMRDHAMLAVLYGCGLRRSELIAMRWVDIDRSRGLLRVTGKGRKWRQVPLEDRMLRILEALRQQTEEEFEAVGDVVFLTDGGKPCYPKFVYNKVVTMLGQVTTAAKRSPHTLRHSMATHLMDHGAALQGVKEVLGHSSLAATQVYTHNSITRLKEVYKQAHPGAGK